MNYSSLIRDTIVSTNKSHSSVCELCDGRYQKIIKVVTSTGAEYNLCEICKAVWIYDKDDTYKVIMLTSSLDQKDIITNTVNFFNKNGCIPSPLDIDVDAKTINMSSQLLKYILFHNDELCEKFNKKNFKLFITPHFNMDNIIIRNIFLKTSGNNLDYWETISKMDMYKIPNKIKKQINKYTQETRIIHEIESSRKRFNKKISDLNSLFDEMNSH